MPRVSVRVRFCAAALLAPALACGPSTSAPGVPAPSPTSAAITPGDLRTRLFIFADDSMLGREAGGRGNAMGTGYIAAEAGRIGLEPAGSPGSFFQLVPLVQRPLSPNSAVTAGDTTFAPGVDFIPRDQGRGARPFDGVPTVDGGVFGDSTHATIPQAEADGKLVVVRVAPGPGGAPAGSVDRAVVTRQFSTAAAIAVATLDAIQPAERQSLQQAGAQLARGDTTSLPTFMYVTSRMADALLRAGAVRGSITFDDVHPPAPARNVVGILPGSDSVLRNQFVALGAHDDHVGLARTVQDHDSLRAWNRVMRPQGAETSPGAPTAAQSARIAALLDSLRRLHPPRPDSVFNGADDDGSGTVALLEIAEALARSPNRPKRSILFVWHTGEELGLLGSDWFTRHPTVERDSIVAQLNMDMIGRGGASDTPGGGPRYLMLVGSRRLSTELGDIVERANAEGKHGFAFDYSWDVNGHPANIYCRSDHYMYARFGIPITFFTTGLHLDYHQLTDEAEYIDYRKLSGVASLVEDVTRRVADLDHRVVVDKPKPDPKGECRQ